MAWVYIGVSRTGRVKVGMSGDPERRCEDLGVRLFHCIQVVPAAAKVVETETLRLLRQEQAAGEWGSFTPEAAVRAAQKAFALVSLSRWTDPSITEEEARLQRISRKEIAE